MRRRSLLLGAALSGALGLSPLLPPAEAQEAPPGTVIGVAYLAFDPVFFFDGVSYQTFRTSYQKQWQRLSVEHGFDLEETTGGWTADTQVTALENLLTLGADAAMLYTLAPVSIGESGIESLQETLPIVFHSEYPAGQNVHPFIGYREREDARELGARMAALFGERQPGRAAGIVVVTSAASGLYRSRVEGFLEGVRQELPGARLLETVDTNGSVELAARQVSAALVKHPSANLFFGATDFIAQGIMAALRTAGRGQIGTELVAGVGGSEAAMTELVDPASPWKGEIGLNIREATELAYRLLARLLPGGSLGVQESGEYRVHSPVFVNPSLAEVRRYLLLNHAVEEFAPR